MTHYVITKLRVDADAWLEEAIWREAAGATNTFISDERRVRPEEIMRARARNDVVDVIASGVGGWLLANDVLKVQEREGQPGLRVQQQAGDAQFVVERY